MAKKGRSPAYPSIDIKSALDRAQELYSKERGNWVPLETAVLDWGLKSKTGVGAVTIAALKYYGLLEDKGSGDERQVHLTELALKIIRDEMPDSQDKIRLIKTAALKPKVFSELLNRYPGGRVSDETLRTILKNNMGYLDDAAEGVVKNFRSMLEFTGLDRQYDPGKEPEYIDLGTTKGDAMLATAQDTKGNDTLKTYFLELPFRAGNVTTTYSIKIPYPITWQDWEKMKGNLDLMLKEVIPDDKKKDEPDK